MATFRMSSRLVIVMGFQVHGRGTTVLPMRGLSYVLSLFATGAVVVFLFFDVIAGVSPMDAAAASGGAVALAAVLTLRAVRLEYELRSQGGDPEVRTAFNRQRERRGF